MPRTTIEVIVILGLGSLVIAALCLVNQGARQLFWDVLGRPQPDAQEAAPRTGPADPAPHA
jgi:hypothetical protein